MSIRSIVEFNHDYGQQLVERGFISEEFWRFLQENGEMFLINGVTYLRERHHTEEVDLQVH